jgi:hypothetical protein
MRYVKLEFRRRLHILYASDGYLLHVSRRKYRVCLYAVINVYRRDICGYNAYILDYDQGRVLVTSIQQLFI